MGKTTYSDGSTPNICIIGAGFSGMTAAIDLKRKLKLETFTIFDENQEVGGTWLVNTYPGCACDVPSHLYSWSFELNPDWPETYSSSADILEYMKKVAQKYDLYSKIKFSTQVKSLIWNENAQKWTVTTFNKSTKKAEVLTFDIVINGPGILHAPNYPEEFENFKGQILHSAEWDSSVDLTDKVVAVIGSGASAIQIIPAIAPIVKEMHCYQRKPAWVLKRFQGKTSYFTKTLFRIFPPLMVLFRTLLYLAFELFYFTFTFGSWMNEFFTKDSLNLVKTHLPADKDLQNKLTPNFTLGCKRVLFHEKYYPAMGLSHVKLHTEKIVKVEDSKILTTEGASPKIDVLILATGFRFSDYFEGINIVGRDSQDIVRKWKNDRPESYLGILSYDTPNHFVLLGPNTALGHNTVVFMIECQSQLIIQIIAEMMRQNAKTVQPKKAIEKEYMANLYEKLKEKVWTKGNCGAWYADPKGNITALWPWTCTTYWRRTRTLNPKAFEFS